jgi:hypothetical protein
MTTIRQNGSSCFCPKSRINYSLDTYDESEVTVDGNMETEEEKTAALPLRLPGDCPLCRKTTPVAV